MIPELGHFALILVLILSIALATIPAIGVWRGNAMLMDSAGSLATGVFVLCSLSYVCLTWAFLADDFSVTYVANNSNSLLPVHYKFSAVWGAHEGSFLLWTLIMTMWTLAVAIFSHDLTRDMRARVLSIMGGLTVGFALFMLMTSNPFDRSLPVPPQDGADLNPLLQDFGLIVHPPMLYMGYVGMSVPFAFAIATLMSGHLDSAWARWSRPWTNVAWAFLTIGITLSSWWAYYELGWGGWWFWDEVENASFMPWLIGTALIHSLAATEKRGVFKSWTVLLAIFAFSFSLLGAFLVRSGVLTSVHTFAVDPERGSFILAFLTLVVGSSLLLYAIRASNIRSAVGFDFTSRETMLLVNNLLLVVATAAILLGTLYPLIYEAMTGGDKLSVGPPYFNAVFVPIAMALFVAMAVSPGSRWRSTPLPVLFGRQVAFIAFSLVAMVASVYLLTGTFEWVPIGAGAVACWIACNLVADAWRKVANKRDRVSALLRQQPSWYGMWLAHLGIAVTVIGVAMTVYFSEERDVRMAPGDVVTLSGYSFRFDGVRSVDGPNYHADRGEIVVTRNGKPVTVMHPEKRLYRARGNVMTEAALDAGFLSDLYVALGEPIDGTAWAVRVHYKPFVRWIWFGGVLIAAGGFVTVLDRRYRRRRAAEHLAGDVAGAAP